MECDGDGYVFFWETFIASQLARENRGLDHLWQSQGEILIL
jgi:hypothetical protein